ncbi:MAG: fibronectin type III domain-containing protein, partial [Gammaproteobacteria bacterium]
MRKLYVLLMAFMLACAANAQTVTIGTGTTTTGQSPWDIFYGYSYVQTIYSGSEINASGNITAIKYYYAGTSLTNNQAIKVYMATVARSSFSSTTNWEPLANLTLVYDGVVGSPTVPGWITITLATPFAYNSTAGNLLIAIDENTSGNNGSTRFRSTTLTPSNRVLYYRSDATNPDPASPPTGTQSSVVGNIQIEGLTLGCQVPTAVTAGSVTVNSATVSWTAPAVGPAPSGYAYEVRTSGAAGSGATGLVTSGNAASTSVNLSSLASGTTYNFYVRTDCGSGNFSGWSTALSFATLCNPYNLPYTLNFESVTPPAIPNCTSIEKIGNGNNWATANVTSNGFSSNVLQYGYNSSNAANAWFYTGGLNLTAGVSYRLVFKYGNNSTTYIEKLAVKFGTSAVNTSMNDLIVDLPSVTGGSAAFSTTDFTVPATGVYYIGFNAYSAANQFNLYVDDINVA